GLLRHGADAAHLVALDPRDHEADEVLVVAADPIVAFGLGIVLGFGETRPHHWADFRGIGNKVEKMGNRGGIADFDHGLEDQRVPALVHHASTGSSGAGEAALTNGSGAASTFEDTTLGTMRRIWPLHSGQGPLWSLGTFCPQEPQPHQPTVESPMNALLEKLTRVQDRSHLLPPFCRRPDRFMKSAVIVLRRARIGAAFARGPCVRAVIKLGPAIVKFNLQKSAFSACGIGSISWLK